MCTAVFLPGSPHLFGRTLDLELSYNESVTVIPRRYPLSFRMTGTAEVHYAILGITADEASYPLFYDAVNERGLCMAALRYPDNARYHSPQPEKDNIASFEVPLWILAQCSSVRQAREYLARMNVTDLAFNKRFSPTPLHWILADGQQCLVVEPDDRGLRLYENPVGVLTNNPPFPFQLDRLRDYRSLSPSPAPSRFMPGTEMHAYSRGLEGIGLPGDFSSASRFVRAAFVRSCTQNQGTTDERILRFFRMTEAIRIPEGCMLTETGESAYTRYTSCYTSDGHCCVITCEDFAPTVVSLSDFDADGADRQSIPLSRRWSLRPPLDKESASDYN